MTKISQKQLIESLKQARQIKPRAEWVSLLKSQILAEKKSEPNISNQPAKFAGFISILSSAFSPKKLAYSLVAILFVIVGI